MRSEENLLDLNSLPEDYTRDGKQVLEDNSSSAGDGTKKSSTGKKENGKVYNCRFCSLKFSKSQALGGHMNRHRREREAEALNRARQLLLSRVDPTLPFTHQVYPTPPIFRSSTTLLPPLPLPLLAPSPPPPPPPHHSYICSLQYLSHGPNSVNDHFVGHDNLRGNTQHGRLYGSYSYGNAPHSHS